MRADCSTLNETETFEEEAEEDETAAGEVSSRRLAPARSKRIHWTVWASVSIAVLATLVLLVTNADRYSKALSTALVRPSTEVGMRREQDAYLAELSQRMMDQFELELRELRTHNKQSLEQSRKHSEEAIRRAVEDEVERKNAKPPPRVDYASVYTGARIVQHSPTHSFGTDTWRLFNLPLVSFNRDPEILLHRLPDEPTAGFCWPFRTSNGFVLVELPEVVGIQQVVYVHAAHSAEPASLRPSAPRIVEAWAGVTADTLEYFGDAIFKPADGRVEINAEAERQAKFVKFVVLNNQGGGFTCLYRLHVYGSTKELAV
ncbi:SUN domain-containing protein 5-like protein [Aphelenchoides fujianensis]|nr:SUN domain-containing protein 5-like protein [Aphelenchoides fujianensis]